MSRRLTLWLLVSLALHAALVAAVLTLLHFVPAPVLFVDLVHDLLSAVEPARSGAARGSGPSIGPRARSAPSRETAATSASRSASPSSRPAGAHSPGAASPPALVTPNAPAVGSVAAPAVPPPLVAAPSPREREPEPAVEAVRPVLPSGPPAALEVAPPVPMPSPSVGGSATPRGARDGSPAAAGGGTSASPGTRGRDGAASGSAERVGGAAGGPLVLAMPGAGGDGAGEYAAYLALLRGRIIEGLAYPPLARRRGLTGTVQVELEVQPTGAISQVTLVASSSHRVLDEAALDAVHGLGRVPFPAGVTPRRLRVRLPVVFDLR